MSTVYEFLVFAQLGVIVLKRDGSSFTGRLKVLCVYVRDAVEFVTTEVPLTRLLPLAPLELVARDLWERAIVRTELEKKVVLLDEDFISFSCLLSDGLTSFNCGSELLMVINRTGIVIYLIK